MPEKSSPRVYFKKKDELVFCSRCCKSFAHDEEIYRDGRLRLCKACYQHNARFRRHRKHHTMSPIQYRRARRDGGKLT